MKAIVTWIGLILGLAALILQFSLTIPLRLGNGDNIFEALLFFFVFFTILSNLLLVLIYAADVWPREAMRWFRAPVTRGMAAAAISLVGLFYHFVLASTWNPQGLFRVADILLHYVTPIVYLAWWVLFVWHGKLKFADIPVMIVPPLIWLIAAMIRGAVVDEYPYPVLEANTLGYGQVAINVVVILAGFTVLCALVVAIDKLLARVDMPGP